MSKELLPFDNCLHDELFMLMIFASNDYNIEPLKRDLKNIDILDELKYRILDYPIQYEDRNYQEEREEFDGNIYRVGNCPVEKYKELKFYFVDDNKKGVINE